MTEVTKAFLAQGIAGAVALVALWWAWRKDRDAKEERDRHITKMDELIKLHREELAALLQRYISKAETWMDKFYERDAAQTEVLERQTEILRAIEHRFLRERP